jgi:hypothetical protein
MLFYNIIYLINMIKSQLAVLLAGLFATSVSAWDNDCPVSGRRPTYQIGTNKIGIDLELTYDLLCPDSAGSHPILMQWLNMTWNVTNTRVIDEISVAFSFMPLPWHNGVWVPYMLIPFFWDNCQYGPSPCQFMDYMQFTFDNQEWIYSAKNMSEN